MKIYLDNCCWNRQFDDQNQKKVRDETVAIAAILKICERAGYRIYSSSVVVDEIDAMQTSRPKRWADVRGFHDRTATEYIVSTPDAEARAQGFMAAGLTGQDHYHLAFAETAGVDVLLTTDSGFVEICENKKLSIVNVVNPIIFLPEVKIWAQ